MIYYEKGDYNKVLECYFQLLCLMVEYGDEVDVGVCYNNIGMIYNVIFWNNDVLVYFKIFFEIMKKCGFKE